jgi:hypothetical protein
LLGVEDGGHTPLTGAPEGSTTRPLTVADSSAPSAAQNRIARIRRRMSPQPLPDQADANPKVRLTPGPVSRQDLLRGAGTGESQAGAISETQFRGDLRHFRGLGGIGRVKGNYR